MSVDKEAFEDQVIADMREHGGVISTGPMAGTRLLVLTTTGARTGQRRRALLFSSKDGADYGHRRDGQRVDPGPRLAPQPRGQSDAIS